MKGLAIGGHKLHEVHMLMTPYNKGVVSHLLYPKNRIKLERTETGIVLKIPPFLAIELYRRGIFPQDSNESFSVAISGKKIGNFRIADLRYPHSAGDSSVIVSLERKQSNLPLSSMCNEASSLEPEGP
jgi:hypothetical protein